jgi:NADH:ubiquinone oxidoreductase subunit E
MNNNRSQIGFHQTDEPETKQKKAEQPESNLIKFINQLYQPNGFSDDRDFKTSLELAYELSDMLEVTPSEVSQVMTALGYEVTTIENQICFIVYELKK